MGVSYVVCGSLRSYTLKHPYPKIHPELKGNAVYAVIGAHIWSRDVGIIDIEQSSNPDPTIDLLEQAGIDISRIECKSKNNRRERSIQEYPGAVDKIRFKNIPANYWAIHGVHLCPSSYTKHLRLASAYKKKGITVSLDPGDYLSYITDDELKELIANIDYFLLSYQDLELRYRDSNYPEALQQLALFKPLAIGVRPNQKNGSLIWHKNDNKIEHIPASDTNSGSLLGAEDAFSAGFLIGMIESNDPKIAMLYGMVSSSLVVEGMDIQDALRFNRYQALIRLSSLSEG